MEENANPDRYVPVDAMRALEREGRLLLYDRYFVTEGTETTAGEAMRMGREIAKELLAVKVDEVLFVTMHSLRPGRNTVPTRSRREL